MVEGTPLLREHLGKTWIEGSNPSVSARTSTANSLGRVARRSGSTLLTGDGLLTDPIWVLSLWFRDRPIAASTLPRYP